ncbi:MAG: F0F1 ATP synthase subunit epsilon [Hyphomicrobiaceae bacterium]|nr:F0F1 ATP synthase subunit epsilon [Hyphomicrobiaceae bacterium]
MAAFKFELVSPEKLILSEEVDQVVVPGTDGDFTVLAGHSPVMTTIRPGFIDIVRAGGKPSKIFIRGGFADVAPNGLTILAEKAMPAEELKADVIAAQIKNAEEDLADAKTEAAKTAAAEILGQLKDIQAALGK